MDDDPKNWTDEERTAVINSLAEKGRQFLRKENGEGYVVMRNGKEVFVEIEDLTEEERDAIAERLIREARQASQHAKALQAYRLRKFGFSPDDDASGETKH